MGKKISKKDILSEIIEKITVCQKYQNADPDSTADERIKMVEEDYCEDPTYYVNITLKDALPEEITSLAERKKHIVVRKELPLPDDMEKFFDSGFIATISVSKDNASYSVSAAGSFKQMVNQLKSKYFDPSCALKLLLPKKSLFNDGYLEDDVNAARAENKSTIVYGLACIKKSEVEKWLEDHYTKDAFDLDKWEFNYFKDAAYVDMTRKTSFEQNVNTSFGEGYAGIMNQVTKFSMKSVLPNFNIKNQFQVIDMGYYVISTLEEIKKTDDAQAKRKYEIYSQGVFKDYLEGKYDTYLANGGGGDWANWSDCQGNFLTYKAIAPTNEEMRNAGGAFRSNLAAYETAADLYASCPFECISKHWKRETDIFKKQPPGGITFTNEASGAAKGAAAGVVQSQLVDPPTVHVKPYGGSSIEFNESPFYSFSVVVKSSPPSEGSKSAPHVRISDPDGYYEVVKGNFKSNNKIDIYRDHLTLDNIKYEYTDVEIDISRNDSIPYRNDITGESGIFLIPEKHYYNLTERMLFKASDMDTRIVPSMLTFHLIPKKLIVPTKFIQESNWTTRDPAEEHLKRAKDEHKEDAVRICIDSIPYDPWERMIDKLNKLYGKWNRLAPDPDGNFELQPIELEKKEQSEPEPEPVCENCEKPVSECECPKVRLCEKYFPIDLFGNEEFSNRDIGMFNASTNIIDKNGYKMSLCDIAKSFYKSLFPREQTKIEDFMVKSDKSELILKTPFSAMTLTQSYSIDGTPISQFDLFNYNRFIEEYKKSLEFGAWSTGQTFFMKKLQTGLMDGILYVPTGFDISIQYNTSSNSLYIDGIDILALRDFVEIIKATGDYEYALYQLNSTLPIYKMGINLKKFILFPVMLDIEKLLAKDFGNIRDYIEEFDEDFIYKPKFEDLLKTISESSTPLITLRFDIYLKKIVKCANPRCKKVTAENEMNEGGCGLDEFFRTPFTVSSNDFDFFVELKKKIARIKINNIRKNVKKFIDTSLSVKNMACCVDRNIEVIEEVKRRALAALFKFAKKYDKIIAQVPRDPIATNGLSVVCQAAKNAKLKSVAEDYNDIFMHTINLMYPLIDDQCNFLEVKFDDIFGDSATLSPAISNYYEEVKEKAPNFNMCDVKNSSYLNEDSDFKSIKLGMLEDFIAQLERGFSLAVTEKFMNHQIYENASQLGLTDPEYIEKATRLIAGGDIVGVKAFIVEHETELKKAETDFSKKFLGVKDDLTKLSELTEISDSAKGFCKALTSLAKEELNKAVIDDNSDAKTKTGTRDVEEFVEKVDNAECDMKKAENDIADEAKDTLENPDEELSQPELLLLENIAEKASQTEFNSIAEKLASMKQMPGDIKDLIILAIEGAKSDKIENQNSEKTKKILTVDSQSEEKENTTDDIILSMTQFIIESSGLYKQLTDETISFD